MKKILFILALVGLSNFSFSQNKDINKNFYKNKAFEKVQYMQSIIRFDNAKARKLEKVEYKYLVDIAKVGKFSTKNSVEKFRKLEIKRDKELRKILTRGEYLKYNAIEKNNIRKHPLHV